MTRPTLPLIRYLRAAAFLSILGGCAAAAALAAEPADSADPPGDPRGIVVEEVRNDNPDFLVRVDVEHPDRVYTRGDVLRVQVVSARAGFLYLLYCDAGGGVTCLFPNAFGQDNRIPAETPVLVPAETPEGPAFRLRVGPPFGEEVLKALVTEEAIPPDALARLMREAAADARLDAVRGVFVEGARRAAAWAEHHVKIVTQDRADAPREAVPAPGGAPRRVGVFIGISDFADERIRDLTVSHQDAAAMADVLRRRGGLDHAWLLQDAQATRDNIETVIRREAVAATRPGDTVIVFWSGHGSRCADDGGDEPDGFDEYLVPADGRLDDLAAIRRTMVLDDAFGRWLQELDGRRILVILDTCHSGGQAQQEKSVGKGLFDAPTKSVGGEFDFLDGEFARIKDIGQRETALLASSTARQVSFERKEGDLSTLTYFLAGLIDQDGGPLTLQDAFGELEREVAAYVEQAFPGTTQTPVLVDQMEQPFLLRP